MPDNLNPTFSAFPPVSAPHVVAFDGVDALAFAQAQFANDVLALPDGHWQWSAWLTPKGRVIEVFALLRLNSGQLLVLLPDGRGAEFASAMQRFVFRRKLKITVRDDLALSGSFSAASEARGAAIAQNGADELALDMGSTALPRTLRIAPAGSAAAPPSDTFALSWQQADLRHGLPHLQPGQREQWTPQQLGLDRLHGYSVKKGCYPGQEIVARTHFLGKAKRSLHLLQVPAGTVEGAAVQQDGASIGTLASVAGELGLAVLPLEIPDTALSVDGHPALPQPLADGLQR